MSLKQGWTVELLGSILSCGLTHIWYSCEYVEYQHEGICHSVQWSESNVSLIDFGQQWSSMAQRTKQNQVSTIQVILARRIKSLLLPEVYFKQLKKLYFPAAFLDFAWPTRRPVLDPKKVPAQIFWTHSVIQLAALFLLAVTAALRVGELQESVYRLFSDSGGIVSANSAFVLMMRYSCFPLRLGELRAWSFIMKLQYCRCISYTRSQMETIYLF